MPRPTQRPRRQPGYLHHKPSNQAYVRLDGRCHYLGVYGCPESHRRYASLIADHNAGDPIDTSARDLARPLTVGELAEQYLQHEAERFGTRNKNTYGARYAMLALTEHHAGLRTTEFRPRALRAIQASLAESDLARSEVNRRVNRIRAAFRWATGEELIPESVYATLTAVPGLRRGEARDNPPRGPVDPRRVDETVVWLQEHGRDGAARLVRFLRWTGCRPSEGCGLRLESISLDHDPPLLTLVAHKTRDRLGEDRIVPLNERAMEVVREAARDTTNPDVPLFRSTRGDAYTSNGLYQSIRTACRSLGHPTWSPYQLRHLVATEVIAATGSEIATAAMLGHSPSSTVVRRYSKDRLQLAIQAARSLVDRP
jgi:integrase